MSAGKIHKLIRKNKAGRDFVVGDLHGRYDLLREMMKVHGFNKKTDRLFSVGDIINRGPDSKKCLKLVKKPWFFMVLGNHELAFIDAIQANKINQYARLYDDWIKKLPRKDLKKWARLLAETPISMTVKASGYSVGICHAEPDGTSWKKSRDSRKSLPIMVMGRRVLRKKPKSKVKGVDFTIHGHTPLNSAMWIGNRYFIDTGAWYSDQLLFRPLNDVFEEYKKRSKAP